MRLAFRLSLCRPESVEEILRWPARKLKWYEAYHQIEPFGPLEEARRLGELIAATAQPWMAKGHTAKPEHYLPELREEGFRSPSPATKEVRLQSDDEILRNLDACLGADASPKRRGK